ncbi:sensor histidine kinase [Cohnella soli]|uniref:histidine kinase n=1 Tax=Cohnella soli TaxID=425005 RepID=A0ABW0HYM6_9BACL
MPALRTYIDNYERHYGIRVRFDCSLRKRPDLLIETTIYRVIQEALTNVGKYAGVSEATVTLHDTGTNLEASVEDRGAGFNHSEAGMRRRAVQHGGARAPSPANCA